MRIIADHDVCIGAGMCVMTAERVFDQGTDGLVVLLVDEVGAADEAQVRDAVRLCPSGALSLADAETHSC